MCSKFKLYRSLDVILGRAGRIRVLSLIFPRSTFLFLELSRCIQKREYKESKNTIVPLPELQKKKIAVSNLQCGAICVDLWVNSSFTSQEVGESVFRRGTRKDTDKRQILSVRGARRRKLNVPIEPAPLLI